MSKAEENRKKKMVAKIKKTASTAKKIDPFVASFTLDGKEIQAQKPYRDQAHIDQEREILADKHGIKLNFEADAIRLKAVIVDNRNKTEKKKDGDPVSPPVPKLKIDYEPETPESLCKKYASVSDRITQHRGKEIEMKERHSMEKSTWSNKMNDLLSELAQLSTRQLDMFKHPPVKKEKPVIKTMEKTDVKKTDVKEKAETEKQAEPTNGGHSTHLSTT